MSKYQFYAFRAIDRALTPARFVAWRVISSICLLTLIGCRFHDPEWYTLPPAYPIAATVSDDVTEIDVVPTGTGDIEVVVNDLPVTVRTLQPEGGPRAGILVASYSLIWSPQDGQDGPELTTSRVTIKPIVYLHPQPSNSPTDATFSVSIIDPNIRTRLAEMAEKRRGTQSRFACRLTLYAEDDNYMTTETSVIFTVQVNFKMESKSPFRPRTLYPGASYV